MTTIHERFVVATKGRGTYDLTERVRGFASRQQDPNGILHVFLRHTSASMILCENADPSVRRDLEVVFQRLAPDGDPSYEHDDEGPDDMPAHIRSVLTQNSLSIPVVDGILALGTWQGLYLWEHRTAPHERSVILSYSS
ncbi:MAG: secondary thiamine-phosphate synthase enzyme [Planctomycetota bacterium]|jgi:secondary thiamine-phosphate synthase enzyme